MTAGRLSAPPGRPRKPLSLLSMRIGVSMSCLPEGDYEYVDRTLSLLSVSSRETQQKVICQVIFCHCQTPFSLGHPPLEMVELDSDRACRRAPTYERSHKHRGVDTPCT